MLKTKVIKTAIISFHLPLSHAGEVIFGGVDDSLYSGKLVYVPITANSKGKRTGANKAWELTATKITVGKKIVKNSNKETITSCLFDTGATKNYAPLDSIVKIGEACKPAGAKSPDSTIGIYTIDCNKRKDLPDLTIHVGTTTLTLKGEDYFLPTSSAQQNQCELSFTTSPLGIAARHSANTWVLGAPFFLKYYTVFDYDGLRMGFGESEAGGVLTSTLTPAPSDAATTNGTSVAMPVMPRSSSLNASSLVGSNSKKNNDGFYY